jgi:hypothetical protein
MKTLGKLLVSIALIAIASGCSQLQPSQTPEPTSTDTESAPNQNQEPTPDDGPVPCQEEIQGEIEKTVNAQTSAFAQSNYELAYSYASPAFRSNISLEGFVQIIASSYGPLIDSSQLRYSNCLVNTDVSFALIDVSFLQSGDFVYALRYLMTQTPDGWRVEGASDLEVVGEGT